MTSASEEDPGIFAIIEGWLKEWEKLVTLMLELAAAADTTLHRAGISDWRTL